MLPARTDKRARHERGRPVAAASESDAQDRCSSNNFSRPPGVPDKVKTAFLASYSKESSEEVA